MFLLPGFERFERKETWNHWTHFLPNCGLCPNKPRAAWSQHPLVRAGRKRVASQGSDTRIFHAQPVHAVDNQQHTIAFFATAIRVRYGFGDTRDRQAHTAAGVHPRHAHSSCLWSDRLPNAFCDFIWRNRVVGIEERNLAPSRAATASSQPNGFVMDVVVVRSCQDLIAFS